MANEKSRIIGKGGLPFLIASVSCGYLTNFIPEFIPAGDLRDWAYRAIPFVSVCILFIIRVLCDIGTMGFSEIVFSHFCATPEKNKLLTIINDPHVSAENKEKAKKRYNEIVDGQMEMNSRRLNYCFGWFKKGATPPPLPGANEE